MTSNPQSSKQWDLGRLVKTLSYFGAIPFLSSVDWFQHWLGSRSDPTINSGIAIAPAVNDVASQAAGQVLVAGAADGVSQQVMQQLEAAVQIVDPDPLAIATWIEQASAIISVIYCADTEAWANPPTLAAFLDSLLQRLALSGLEHQPIFDFANLPDNLREMWGALDDVVMGGVSESGVRLRDGIADFSGVVSTANSGGFASIRTRNFEPALNLAAYDGIELRLKGDGKRYKFMLRTETRWDGIAYCYSFDTAANQWITVQIPFSKLVPVFRAKTVSDQSINPAHVTALQLMLSKFEYDGALNPRFEPGFFQLQVESIRAYRQDTSFRFILVEALNASGLEPQVQQSGLPYKVIRLTQLTETQITETQLTEIQLQELLQSARAE